MLAMMLATQFAYVSDFLDTEMGKYLIKERAKIRQSLSKKFDMFTVRYKKRLISTFAPAYVNFFRDTTEENYI
jgi:hypothetical protein